MQTHEWLPNETLHFQNVRCIECHTQINDSILVAHLVLPKEKALLYQVIPLFRVNNVLTLATADPNDIFVFDEDFIPND